MINIFRNKYISLTIRSSLQVHPTYRVKVSKDFIVLSSVVQRIRKHMKIKRNSSHNINPLNLIAKITSFLYPQQHRTKEKDWSRHSFIVVFFGRHLLFKMNWNTFSIEISLECHEWYRIRSVKPCPAPSIFPWGVNTIIFEHFWSPKRKNWMYSIFWTCHIMKTYLYWISKKSRKKKKFSLKMIFSSHWTNILIFLNCRGIHIVAYIYLTIKTTFRRYIIRLAW